MKKCLGFLPTTVSDIDNTLQIWTSLNFGAFLLLTVKVEALSRALCARVLRTPCRVPQEISTAVEFVRVSVGFLLSCVKLCSRSTGSGNHTKTLLICRQGWIGRMQLALNIDFIRVRWRSADPPPNPPNYHGDGKCLYWIGWGSAGRSTRPLCTACCCNM